MKKNKDSSSTPLFDIPFNGDINIANMAVNNKKNIFMVYGRADDNYPNGRNTSKSNKITLENIFEVNRRLLKEDIVFNYVLNGIDHSNKEFNFDYRQKFMELIKNLKEHDINMVTIANPFLLEMVRQKMPDMKIMASVILEIDNHARASQIAKEGVSYICLSKTLLKNFNALEKMQTNKPEGVEYILLANDPCLSQCAYTQYHNMVLSNFTAQGGDYVNYCRLHCTQDLASDPKKIIGASFIRPEDLKVYMSKGYNLFKLCDRKQTTEWIEDTLNAYIEEKFDGNLSDIMAPWSKKGGKYPSPNEISEEDIKEKGIEKLRDNLRFSPNIDNKSMDNYLDFWMKNKPDGCEFDSCNKCNYCETVASKAYFTDTNTTSIVSKNIDVALKNSRI